MRSIWFLPLLALIAITTNTVPVAVVVAEEPAAANETKDEGSCKGEDCPKTVNDDAVNVVVDALGNTAAATVPAETGECVDQDENCPVWSSMGECEKNKAFMVVSCAKSCNACESAAALYREPAGCEDTSEQCSVWKKGGECEKNPTYMAKYCCASCDPAKAQAEAATRTTATTPKKKKVVQPEKQTEMFVPEEDCVNKHEHCDHWLSNDECIENPHYMAIHCPKICDFCGKTIKLEKQYDATQYDAYGIMQTIMPDKIEETHAILKAMEKYVDGIRESTKDDPEMAEVMEKECTNKHAQCAFWATLGECRKNPTYMKITCAPVCSSCDHIGMMQRCPLDPTAPRAFSEPGDLNLIFFNLTTHEAFEKYEPTVLSRPSYLNGDNRHNADYKVGPWVITLDNFLSDTECDRLIELGHESGYQRSGENGQASFDGTYNPKIGERRTSTNTWCNTPECLADPVTQDVMDRIAEITQVPVINQEYLQMLRYEEGQHYKVHHDYIESQANRPPGVRMMTVFLYLNNVQAGGGTHFPGLDITVMPKRGSVLIWPSVMDEDTSVIDPRTQHEALPVEQGLKYAANAWIHQRDFQGPFKENCV